MNTATATPVTEQADRTPVAARSASAGPDSRSRSARPQVASGHDIVPDPPRDAAGRKQYWEDTVAEAVAELRRRLASRHDDKSFQALQMILDLEKTRLRHKAPVAGTEVETRWSAGLGSLEDSTSSGGRYAGPEKVEKKDEDLTPPVLASRGRQGAASWEGEAPAEPPTTHAARPIPMHIPVKLQDGIRGHFRDRDDDRRIDPDRLAMHRDGE